MRIVTTDDLSAQCQRVGEEGGALEAVSLALTGPLAAGSHILVHVDAAIRVLDAEEARQIADALAAVAAASSGQPFEHLLADLIDREPQLPPGLQPDPVPESAQMAVSAMSSAHTKK